MLNSPIEEIKNRLDIVEVISQYIKPQKAGANFRALCPFHSEKTPSFFISPARQIWHCFGCFPVKSLIKTEKGFHNIEDIQVGQTVLTHKGRYMPVIRTLWRPYKGDLIDIKTRKSSQVVSLTADHEVYVMKTKNCPHKSRFTRICQRQCDKKYCPRFYLNYKIEKLSADQLTVNDFLLFPINQDIKDIEVLDLKKYYNRRISNYGPDIGDIPDKIKVDEKFLKLIGYYIAEGSNRRAYIRFSLGNHEEKFAQEIKNLIEGIFKIKTTIYRRKERNKAGLEITACNSKLSNIFENLCGLHAENKHIPFEFQCLPYKKQRIILDAIYKGDGYSGKVNKCKRDRKFKAVTTISLVLAEQLRDILLRLNIAPTFFINKERTDKKQVHHKKSFLIHWQENYALSFSHFYKDKKEEFLYWLSPIKEIKKREFKGNVYNLTVAEDHSYTTPNFVVGNCGKGGDIFGFVKEIEGVEFGDALRILAQKAGVELKKESPQLTTERQRLYEICELATRFFEKQLKSSRAGQEVRKYLLGRGIIEESIRRWRLGYAPESWRGLSDFLVSRGYKREEVEKAGLAIKSSNIEHQISNSYYDRFRSRIIFPIFDFNSQVIGFGGRIFGETKRADGQKEAKYINTPSTLLYDKSRALYGLDKAKIAIRKKNECILVEGYTDVIMSYQIGVENVVATSGTALTYYQLKILKRYSNNLLTAFDTDVAGDSATKRGIDLAIAQDFNVKVITLPQDKDPADIISQNVGDWQKFIEGRKSIMEFYFETTFNKFNKQNVEDKKQISQILLPIIKKIPNKIEQAHWIQLLAKKLEVKEEDIQAELKRTHFVHEEAPAVFETPPPVFPPKPRKQLLEERLVSLILKSPHCLGLINENHLDCFSPYVQEILVNFKKGHNFKLDNLLINFNNHSPQLVSFLNQASLEAEFMEDEGIEPKEEIAACLKEIFSFEMKNKLDELSKEIKKAEEEKSFSKIDILMENFNKLAKQLTEYESH